MKITLCFASLTALLIGCAAPMSDSAPPPDLSGFTTQGKPTKTVQTPWGEKRIYDPIQDAEVVSAYKYLYSLPAKHPGRDIYADLFQDIRETQWADLMRIGCGGAEINGCSGLYIESDAAFVCRNKLSMGQSDLNVCEAENTQALLPEGFLGSCEFGPDNIFYQGDFRYEFIGTKQLTGVRTAEDEMKYFFNAQCNFFTNEDSEKIELR